MRRWAVQCIACVAIASGVMSAHHSLSGAYDTSREITLEGVITVFQFVNPHPFVTISIETRGGDKQQWRLEMDNRSELVGYRNEFRDIEAGGSRRRHRQPWTFERENRLHPPP